MMRERVLYLERECEQLVDQAFEGIDHRWSGRRPVDRVALEPVIGEEVDCGIVAVIHEGRVAGRVFTPSPVMN